MYLFRRTQVEIKPTNHCELWVHESLTPDLHRAIGVFEHSIMGCVALRSGPLTNGNVPGKNGLMFQGPEVVRYCDKEHFVTYATELKEKFCHQGFEKEVPAELESALRTAQNAIYPGLP